MEIKKKIRSNFTCRYCSKDFKVSNLQSWTLNKSKCPNCNETYCNLKHTEKKLRELQDFYYDSNKDSKYLTLMYEILFPYSNSLCLRFFSKKIKQMNLYEDVSYYANKGCVKLIEQYIRKDRRNKDDFKINDSFSGYLMHKLRESIFEKDERRCADYSTNEDDYVHKEESKDCSFITDLNYSFNKDNMLDMLDKYINDVIPFGEFKVLIAFLNFIKYGSNVSDQTFILYGNEGKALFLKILETFKLDLSRGYFSK